MPELKVIYQDEVLMVIDKPPGLVVDPSQTQKRETLADILKNRFSNNLERGGIVHRLDKDTSGLLLIAKTRQALEVLQAQFKRRQVKKEYLALCHGFLDREEEALGAIARNPKNRERFIVLEEGRKARTRFVPIKKYQLSVSGMQSIFGDWNKNQKRRAERSGYGKFTLVRCFPQTGRTHQIRVHLKHIGHPLVGDQKYSGRKTARQDGQWCPRQFLHAARLEFGHPLSGERMEFTSQLPSDLARVLERLEA